MKSSFLFALLLFSSTAALSHPSVSIVIDSKGNVYYSDLERVWMIKPDGTKQIAVANVHTHELWVGPDDVLYGEDVTNVGDLYRHRVWKRYPDGKIENELDWREGHPVDFNDYGFQRDKAGHSYVLIRADRRIDVRSNQGILRSITLAPYEGYIHQHTVRQDGSIYLTIGDALIYFAPQKSTGEVLATGLIHRSEAFGDLHDRHALMGIWTDEKANAHVAVASGQRVTMVTRDGNAKTAFQRDDNWSISGGTTDTKGRTWLLEYSTRNEVRVRRIDKKGEKVF